MTHSRFALFTLLISALPACAAGAPPAAEAPRAATAAPAPVPLARSLFSHDVTGSLTEDDLQRVLDSRLDLEFPARLGVVALSRAFDPEEHAGVAEQSAISRNVTRAIHGSRQFSAVTDVSTDLPNPAGVEGLRTIAARYRTRYLLLCSTVEEDTSHLNNWAWLYATGVGVLLAPGKTVATQGLLQASLFDVKSGTVLFTVQEPYQSSSVTWLVGSGRTHDEIDSEAMREASRRLGKKISTESETLARWAATRS